MLEVKIRNSSRRDGEDGRDGIDGENDVGALDRDQGKRQRGEHQPAAVAGQELRAVKFVADGQEPSWPA